MDPTAATPPARRRLRRRWRVPPAIMHGPDEPLESAGVLDEIEGAAGLVVWQSLRDVTLWASTPPSERGDLFAPGAERNRIASILTVNLDPDLEQPLGMVTAMVGRPDRVSAERVALACRRVSQWAEKNGKLATALAFAQAAAVSCPGDASAAFKVGQIARRQAEYVRSETWFRRAIALARQEGDWTSYALAFSGLGNLYIQRGNFPKARTLHHRALRAATRHSLRSIQGDALHDLFILAGHSGDVTEAQRNARMAFEVYGSGHSKLSNLAHDVAYFWLTQGFFAPALSVFQSLIPLVGNSQYRLQILANTARAAGGAGALEVFEHVWDEAWGMLSSTTQSEGFAEAMLELARGAASVRAWERAENAASRSLEVATERKEGRIRIDAESVLDSVRNERRAGLSGSISVGTDDREAILFAEDLVKELESVAVAL